MGKIPALRCSYVANLHCRSPSYLRFEHVLAAATRFAADDAFMGIWKLNEPKSKIADGSPKSDACL